MPLRSSGSGVFLWSIVCCFQRMKFFVFIGFISVDMTIETEMPFNSGSEEGVSMNEKEKRHFIPRIEEACVLGETFKNGGDGAKLDSQGQGPQKAAVSNGHVCPVSINQTKEKATQTTEDPEDGRKVQSEEAPMNRKTFPSNSKPWGN